MAEPALETLLDIVRDPASGLRNRLSAAIAASRVERLAMPGEQAPEGVLFLREIVGTEHEGSRFRVEYRLEAGRALSYYERRTRKAELQFEVPDQAERRESWRKLINSALRVHLSKHGYWPAGKDMLLQPGDEFEMPALDPEIAYSAMMLGGNRHQRRHRQKVLDERLPGKWTGDETERAELIRVIATAAHQRLLQFGLAR